MIAFLISENADLRERLAVAHERIRQLEHEAFGARLVMPACLGLTPDQSAILGVILSRPVATPSLLAAALSAGRYADARVPTDTSIRVQVCYIRKALARHGLVIERRYREGYRMSDADKAKLTAIIRQPEAPPPPQP